MAKEQSNAAAMRWKDLPEDVRDALWGKLAGLWGTSGGDGDVFDSLPVDKQQALLLIQSRMQDMNLWHLVRKLDNVYGEGGVGIAFYAWPVIKSTLMRRRDFTRLFANHKDTSGGFYERGQAGAILHFLYVEGNPRKWYVHFDLHSPVHSPRSAYRHFRHEFVGKVTPDWQMIQQSLKG